MIPIADEIMETPWATPARIAAQLMACLCATLGCSPFGVPLLGKECGHNGGEDSEACKIVMPGPALETLCCGAVAVAINRFFWHDGSLNEIRNSSQVPACDEDGTSMFWGAEVSLAVLRCVPSIGGWGGLPIAGPDAPVGDVDADTLTDHSTILMSDAMAIMLAMEMCFGCHPEVVPEIQHKKNRSLWLPASVNRISYGPNCRGNAVGFGRNTPIRVNLSNDRVPCAADCLELAAAIGI